MKLILYLSDCLIPLLIFYIVANGICKKIPVYDSFIEGAEEGLKTVVQIVPTLIGLMVGVGVLRTSGFLDALAGWLSAPMEAVGFPAPLVPVAIVRMFSSSAATGLVLDIFQSFGPDSQVGKIVSVMMGCSETIFYTMSVYFMTAKVKKTRWTLAGALLCTGADLIASVVLGGMM